MPSLPRSAGPRAVGQGSDPTGLQTPASTMLILVQSLLRAVEEASYRRLSEEEVRELEARGNVAEDWTRVLIKVCRAYPYREYP